MYFVKPKTIKRSIISATVMFAIAAVPLFASAQTATLSRTLAVGASGSDVTALQTYLASDPSIYPEGLVTGYYGALTSAAVARFQASVGLPQVGNVGPLTLAAINQRIGGGADDSAPILMPETVSATRTSATIVWATNEPASSRVMYASTRPFLYSSAFSTVGLSGISHSVTLANLSPGQVYYYTVESADPSGNDSVTLQKQFSTLP